MVGFDTTKKYVLLEKEATYNVPHNLILTSKPIIFADTISELEEWCKKNDYDLYDPQSKYYYKDTQYYMSEVGMDCVKQIIGSPTIQKVLLVGLPYEEFLYLFNKKDSTDLDSYKEFADRLQNDKADIYFDNMDSYDQVLTSYGTLENVEKKLITREMKNTSIDMIVNDGYSNLIIITECPKWDEPISITFKSYLKRIKDVYIGDNTYYGFIGKLVGHEMRNKAFKFKIIDSNNLEYYVDAYMEHVTTNYIGGSSHLRVEFHIANRKDEII